MNFLKLFLIPMLVVGLFFSCDNGSNSSSSPTEEDAADATAEASMEAAFKAMGQAMGGGVSNQSGVSRATSEPITLEAGLSITLDIDTTVADQLTFSIGMIFDSYKSDDVSLSGTIDYVVTMNLTTYDSEGTMKGNISAEYEGVTYSMSMNLVSTSSTDSSGNEVYTTIGTITCDGVTVTINESETFPA